ncbi:DUF7507 domain-containing protein [Taklimakanibacter lacteus]|uniref:DUF7507 domain-containing protein n=1 Tax=Taklimakanibacter lacteus TaxID=2268456 RepID=UPI000E661F7C
MQGFVQSSAAARLFLSRDLLLAGRDIGRSVLAALVMISAVFFSSATAHAQAGGACNLAVNGSFESPNIQTEPQRPGENTSIINGYAIWRTTTYPLDGWQTVSGTVDLLRYHSNASDGMQSIDLWGTAPATLRQTFTGLLPGQQYTFSIDYAGQSASQSIASVRLGNGNGVAPVTIATLQPVANSILNGGSGLPTTPYYTQTWATYQHTFVAAGTAATIQFVNNAAPGPGNTGLFIDNFTFASAEPCTDLSITKDDGATTFTRGSNVTYTIVVSNNGSVDAPSVQVSDPLPTGITTATWTCGSATGGAACGVASGTGAINTTADMPAGSSVTYTLTLTVPPSYSGVILTNTATVTAPDGITDPDTSNNTATDSNAVSPAQPGFGSCDASLYLAQNVPTGLFEFNTSSNPFIVNPVGPASSVQYNAIAMHPTNGYIYGLQGPAGTLVRIGSDGSVVNLGAISGLSTNSVSGEIGPDGTYYVAAGGLLYRINLETKSATSVVLSQNIGTLDMAWHNGLLYTAVDSSNLYAINPANGSVTTIGLTGTTGPFGGMFGATNGVFGSNNNGGFYRFDLTTGAATLISALQGSGSNDGAKCVTTPMNFPADLAITKNNGTDIYATGVDTTYTIVVTNDGPFGAQGALVSDPLPTGITEATWTCGAPTNGGVCSVPSGTGPIENVPVNLPVGASVTFELTISIPDTQSGSLSNTATVTPPGGTTDPDLANNEANDTDLHEPALELQKTGMLNDLNGNDLIDPGETITYSFLVRNTGSVTLTNVTVSDPLVTVDQGPQTLAPNATFTFTATYAPTQADIDAGAVTNTATTSGTTPSGETAESPPDSVTVPPAQTPGMTVDKTGTLNDLDGDGLLDLGETISYSFLVRNTGAVTLTNVTVNDPLVTVNQGPQTLAPNATFTFTATYTPTQADIDAGSVTNTATTSGTTPSGETTESPPDSVTVPPEQTPGMTVDKTGTLNDLDGDGLLDLGETISYSFLVRNTGAVTLTNVTVNDPLVTVNQGPQTLAPNATFTFTATYTPTQADIDAGSVTNTATATGTTPDGETTESPPDSVTVPPEQTPGMTVDKTGTLNDLDGDGLLDLGETISYSFLVRNTGNVTLTNVTVNDPLVTIDQGPQTLAPNATFTFTATYTPTQADIDAGTVTNTATATGTTPGGETTESPPDSVTVPPEQTPGMTVDKTGTLNDLDGDGLLDLGETISYSFLVRNTGAVTLTNVTVSDPLVTVDQGPQTLAPNATFTFTATYTPTQADIDAGSVTNTATATGTTPGGETTESPPDSVTVPPEQTPGMTIDKTGTLNDLDGDGLLDLGETISYSFLVGNTGAVTLTNVTVSDPLVSVNEGPQTLAPGATFTFTATYTPTQADIDNGSVTNTATASGTTPSGETTESPPDSVTVPPQQTPGMTVDKTGTLNDLDGDGLLDLGETISYSFLVRNTGNVTLSNVTVSDPLVTVNQGAQTLAPNATFTFTATYTPTQADIDAGSVTNTATATGTTPGGETTESPPDSVTVPPEQTPGMTVDKTGTLNDLDGDGLLDLGETISYSFLVRNTGSVTLTNVTVSDPLVTVNQGPQTLAPNATFTFTATYTPTQADIDAGSVTNTATATGTTPDGETTESPPDSVTVPPEQTPGMTVDKTGTLNDLDGDGLLDLGETISYSFLVRNTGTVTLTNVAVNDPLVTIDQGAQTLAPNATFTFTATYTPTQADIDAGSVTNTATATGTTPDGETTESPPDSVTVPPEQTPGMTVDKTGTLNDLDGDGLLDLGETISYSFLVRNTGTVTLTNVTVNDPLVTIDQGPQTLAPNATFTFTATYTPTQADIDAGSVTNTATAGGTTPGGETTESPPDSVTVPPEQTPGMTVEKTGILNDLDGDGLLDLGETISYSFLVRNTGSVTLTNVTVNDPLVTVNEGPQTLAPGGNFTFHASYTPTQADIDAGSVTNTATASGTTPGGETTESPPDSVTVPPQQTPGMTIDKTGALNDLDGDGVADLGETIGYSFLVTNTGTVTLTNVMINDPLVAVDQGPQTLAPGATFTFTATYAPTQADIDAGGVTNTATATGTIPGGGAIESPPDSVTITIPPPASLTIQKTGAFNDVDGNGYASVGDTITYSFAVTNTGGQTATGVSPQDAGPTFNGQPASNSLSAFEPTEVTLAPGASQTFTATYVLSQQDIDNAAGVTDGIRNSATARGTSNGSTVPSNTSTSDESMPAVAASDITIVKQAGLRQIRRGEKAPFIIRVTNNSSSNVAGITVTDVMPSGFRYVDGSATVDGIAATPVVNGLRVRFDNISIGPNAEVVIRLQMLALSSAGPGEHTNRAIATGPDGRVLAEAKASVEIVIEAVFDCGDIIGKVFDDLNRNGYQDDGEPGLPGVRVATAKGWLITTDKFGRFHVPCAALPDQRIGSNFIMKLDTRTLPLGYRLTTENPRVIRLTAGKMSKLNFGASIGRVVRVDLRGEAFEAGSAELRPRWARRIDKLIEVLSAEQSVLRLSYIDARSNEAIARKRLDHFSELIRERWRERGGRYRLEIETRVEVGQ